MFIHSICNNRFTDVCASVSQDKFIHAQWHTILHKN